MNLLYHQKMTLICLAEVGLKERFRLFNRLLLGQLVDTMAT